AIGARLAGGFVVTAGEATTARSRRDNERWRAPLRDRRSLEVRRDLVDAEPGLADPGAAYRDQLGGSGGPLGESIDVDVGALERAQDRVELVQRPGVAELVGRALFVGGFAHVSSIRLLRCPSATWVVMVSPAVTSPADRTTRPAASRVMLHPRASRCWGSSRVSRARTSSSRRSAAPSSR